MKNDTREKSVQFFELRKIKMLVHYCSFNVTVIPKVRVKNEYMQVYQSIDSLLLEAKEFVFYCLGFVQMHKEQTKKVLGLIYHLPPTLPSSLFKGGAGGVIYHIPLTSPLLLITIRDDTRSTKHRRHTPRYVNFRFAMI